MFKLDITPTWKFRRADVQVLDPMLFELLRALHETPKLTKAAQRMGVSYRFAWNLVQRWSDFFGCPLVEKRQGKGASLTPLGAKLLWAERLATERLAPQLESLASELQVEIHKAVMDSTPILRVHASHGYAIGKLPELLASQTNLRLDLQFKPGVAALKSLLQSRCDLAGFHLPEGEYHAAVLAEYLPWIRPRAMQAVLFAKRHLGLMMAPGNPRGVSGINDLIRGDLRFVNRERGSGTRSLLDRMLGTCGIDGSQINGYENEEFTHGAVAAFVASGMADVGLGVETAARQFKLDFLPIVTERYYLATRTETLGNPAVEALLAFLRGPEFRNSINSLPGYDAADSGVVARFAELFPELRS